MIFLEDQLSLLTSRLPVHTSHTKNTEDDLNNNNHQNRVTIFIEFVLIETQEANDADTVGIATERISCSGADGTHIQEFKTNKSLVSITEEGDVGEPNPTRFETISVGEETRNEGKGHDAKRSVDEGSFGFATSEGTKQQTKSICTVGEHEHNAEVAEEVGGSSGFVTISGNSETRHQVDNHAEESGRDSVDGKFDDGFGPIEGIGTVQTVGLILEEDGELRREGHQTRHEGEEGRLNNQQEEETLTILDTRGFDFEVEEDKTDEDGEDDGLCHTSEGEHGITNDVTPRTSRDESELMEEGRRLTILEQFFNDFILVLDFFRRRSEALSDVRTVLLQEVRVHGILDGRKVFTSTKFINGFLGNGNSRSHFLFVGGGSSRFVLLVSIFFKGVDVFSVNTSVDTRNGFFSTTFPGSDVSVEFILLGLEELHGVFDGVDVFRHGTTDAFHVVTKTIRRSVIDNRTLGEENEIIEESKEFGRGGVDGADDSTTFSVSERAHQLADTISSDGVKTRSGFIEEDDGRVVDEFDTDVGSAFFTTRETLDQTGNTHDGVLAVGELEFVKHILSLGFDFFSSQVFVADTSGEAEGIERSFLGHDDIILGDEGDNRLVLSCHDSIIQVDNTIENRAVRANKTTSEGVCET